MSNYIKNLLKDYGYNMVSLPKADIEPLLLLTKDGLNTVSSLDNNLSLLFEPDEKPLVRPTSGIAPILGKKALNFDLSTEIDFLSSLFKALKLDDSKLKASAGANKSYSVDFSFENVLEDKVGLLDLDSFLSGAIPLEGQFKTYEKMLKNSELYVITSTLKSNNFSIKITDANGQSLDLDANALKMVDASAKVSRQKDDSFMLTHTGDSPLIFAFKAVQIIYDQTKWFEFWKSEEAGFRIEKEHGITLKRAEEEKINPLLLTTESGVIDL